MAHTHLHSKPAQPGTTHRKSKGGHPHRYGNPTGAGYTGGDYTYPDGVLNSPGIENQLPQDPFVTIPKGHKPPKGHGPGGRGHGGSGGGHTHSAGRHSGSHSGVNAAGHFTGRGLHYSPPGGHTGMAHTQGSPYDALKGHKKRGDISPTAYHEPDAAHGKTHHHLTLAQLEWIRTIKTLDAAEHLPFVNPFAKPSKGTKHRSSSHLGGNSRNYTAPHPGAVPPTAHGTPTQAPRVSSPHGHTHINGHPNAAPSPLHPHNFGHLQGPHHKL